MKYCELSNEDKAFLLDRVADRADFYENSQTGLPLSFKPAFSGRSAFTLLQGDWFPPFSLEKPFTRVRIRDLNQLSEFKKIEYIGWPPGLHPRVPVLKFDFRPWGDLEVTLLQLALELGVEVWGVA